MSKANNFFRRAIDAIVEGRTRQAERFIAQYERDNAPVQNKVKSR